MEENFTQNTENFNQTTEPEVSDNSTFDAVDSVDTAVNQPHAAGESYAQDPAAGMLLGKFKSVDDLSNAYEELQKYQGRCSDELGHLRKEMVGVSSMKQTLDQFNNLHSGLFDSINRDKEKYNSPEYFQDPTFREIYKEAIYALGDNLDTDKFINLLESYVSARIFANDKKKAAQKETQNILGSMTYDKNSGSTFSKPKKRFDEMTDKEIDELLERRLR